MPTMLKVFLKFNYKRELFVSFNRDSELTVFLIYVNRYMIMLIVICHVSSKMKSINDRNIFIRSHNEIAIWGKVRLQ